MYGDWRGGSRQQGNAVTVQALSDKWRTALRGSRNKCHAKAAAYWRYRIASSGSNPRDMWKSLNIPQGEIESKSVPTFTVTDFHNSMDKKIDDIRTATSSAATPLFADYKASLFDNF